MPLTQEEKDELRLERSDAKYHMKQTYQTILQLKKILKQYETDWMKWDRRFRAADYALAEEEKLIRLPGPGEKKTKMVDVRELELTKEQILQIAEDLGIEIDIEEDEELEFED